MNDAFDDGVVWSFLASRMRTTCAISWRRSAKVGIPPCPRPSTRERKGGETEAVTVDTRKPKRKRKQRILHRSPRRVNLDFLLTPRPLANSALTPLPLLAAELPGFAVPLALFFLSSHSLFHSSQASGVTLASRFRRPSR